MASHISSHTSGHNKAISVSMSTNGDVPTTNYSNYCMCLQSLANHKYPLVVWAVEGMSVEAMSSGQ